MWFEVSLCLFACTLSSTYLLFHGWDVGMARHVTSLTGAFATFSILFSSSAWSWGFYFCVWDLLFLFIWLLNGGIRPHGTFQVLFDFGLLPIVHFTVCSFLFSEFGAVGDGVPLHIIPSGWGRRE
ncbi:hypothetical protein B0T17DRAFT_40527 [Bombardia bombarda]|uniref:Uncharacterized protein n=1 Tax=Bombardia bombarda TaxID=252184 RepID=A0AA39XKQ0_9PEZI|nr:hypothetical protein B0T17DRAFT_40527 [Bombardia bombarda]